MLDIDQLNEEIAKQLAGAEDEVISHRLDYAITSDTFIEDFTDFVMSVTPFLINPQENADNIKQKFTEFIISQFDLNDTSALQSEGESGSPSST